MYTVKKLSFFPVPNWDVTNQTLPKIFPARESLLNDIPAGDGINDKKNLQCGVQKGTVLHVGL